MWDDLMWRDNSNCKRHDSYNYSNYNSNNYPNYTGIESLLRTLTPGTTINRLVLLGIDYEDVTFVNYDRSRNLAYFNNDGVIVVEANKIQSLDIEE
ncbi:hypothetical protein GMB86_02855 [Terrilactibacillus sp. BCM23-1]|uniref:Uncharacterized protein n=1 Tax=Terrilactibacillus tamarindi TaxID=2599694 RepID=A0A6N8CLT3_9BACI|nr:hypothetical protein [Terrilactibacillus tamarindi]MTT30954.1 hypothetical protein [Terrilactibacillus tamarindi]